jgi:tetratricopeptide (TPR) repeat protein
MEQNKDDPDIYYHRAQLHFILGEFAEAAKDYQKSIDLDRDFIFSHIQLGVTQYKMGSIASSMATFRRCIKNFEKVPDVYNYYGELLLDQQKYQEAVEKFDTAVEMEKQTKPMGMNVLPLINKALAMFQWKQDFQEAEKLCEKALISSYALSPHPWHMLTRAKSIRNATSQLLQWHNSCFSRARSPRRSGTSRRQPSCREPRERSSTPCLTQRRRERSWRCRRSIQSSRVGYNPSAEAEWEVRPRVDAG